MMKPTACDPGQILIPKQTLIKDDPRVTGIEKQALLARVGVIQSGIEKQGRKNPRLTWSVCQSALGWYGQSTEDKETIHTDLYDVHGHLRGFAQVDWFNETETPEVHFYTRINHHSPGNNGDISATDRQTGVIIKTMPRATVMSPGFAEILHELGVWYSDHLFVQTSHNLMEC
jgi:hypothetical protein